MRISGFVCRRVPQGVAPSAQQQWSEAYDESDAYDGRAHMLESSSL